MKKTKKKKGNQTSPFSFPQSEITKALRELTEKEYFGTRKKLNEEFVEYVKNSELSKDFRKQIKEIRKKYKIPRLNFQKDTYCYSIQLDEKSEYDVVGSKWLLEKDEKTKKAFKKEIDNLINYYELPKIFFDWLECLVLYNHIPPRSPWYNWDLIFQIADDIKELNRVPLTTQEKKYIKQIFRWKMGIKRRPPKNKEKAYKIICKALKKAKKNRRRRFRTIEDALKTLEQGKSTKLESEYDFYEEKIMEKYPLEEAERLIKNYRKENLSRSDELKKRKKDFEKTYTYNKLVAKLFPGEHGLNDKKISQRLRKQKQRLKERTAKIMKKRN